MVGHRPNYAMSVRSGARTHLLWDVRLQLEQRHHGQWHPGLVLRHGQHGHRALSVSAFLFTSALGRHLQGRTTQYTRFATDSCSEAYFSCNH